MAAPKKTGLDYFPFDVDFFQDTKIKGVKRKFGFKGVCVYQYLLCEIYRTKGYYTIFDDDLLDDICDTFNETEEFIQQVINYLCSRSLLDNKLCSSVKVITSHSIQRRYQSAKNSMGYKKGTVDVDSGYWILSVDETLDCIKVTQKGDSSGKNGSYSEKNHSYSEKNGIKESKENKSKVNNIKPKGFNDLLSGIKDDELRTLYQDFINMRKAIKSPMTVKALQMLIERVNKLEPDSIQRQKSILEQSIINSWKGVYPLKGENTEKSFKDSSIDLDGVRAKINNFD